MKIIGYLFFIFYGLFFIKKIKIKISESKAQKEFYKKTEAKITKIILNRDIEDSTQGHLEIHVQYFVKNIEINSYSFVPMASFNIGDSIDVYYNPNNIREIKFGLDKIKYFNFFICFGYIAILFGIFGIVMYVLS